MSYRKIITSVVYLLILLAESSLATKVLPIELSTDQSQVLSDDGSVLVWLRTRQSAEVSKMSLCMLTAPFTMPREELHLGPVSKTLATVRMTPDGRHVFFVSDGSVRSVSVETGVFRDMWTVVPPYRPGGFGFQINSNASVFCMLVDGSNTPAKSPSYRALVTGGRPSFQGVSYGQPLTPMEYGKMAWNPIMDGSGQYMVYHFDGHKQATYGRNGWVISPLEFPDYSLCPIALSADGLVMLMRGCRTNELPATPSGIFRLHVLQAHRVNGTWGDPVTVLRCDETRSYESEAMSSDGRWLIWCDRRTDKDRTTTSMRLQCMCREQDGWSKPETLYEHEGHTQFWNTCIATNGTAAWTRIDGNVWKGYVRTPGGATVCLE